MATRLEVTAAPTRTAARPGDSVAMGTILGLLAGVAMGLVLLVAAWWVGMPALHPFLAVGASFLGPEALEGGAGIVLYGAALHLLLSAALGVCFVALVPRDMPPVSAAGIGIGFALLALGVIASVLVPVVNPVFRAEMQPMGGAWVIAHFVYGLVLGVLFAVGRRSAAQA
jgi:hypothetical protein